MMAETDWSSGCQLPVRDWIWLNRDGIFEEETLARYVAPFPPSELMIQTYGISENRVFAKRGAEIYQALFSSGPSKLSDYKNILVLNCGCGLLLRLFKGHAGRITTCDPILENVEWIQRNLTFVECIKNPGIPPLPFSENQFDAVIALSLFPSLDKDAHDRFLDELHRITSKNGALFLSLHGGEALARIKNEPDLLKRFSINSHLFDRACMEFEAGDPVFIPRNPHETPRSSFFEKLKNVVKKCLGKKRNLRPGISFIPRVHVENHWSNWFHVKEYRAGAIDNFQDLAIVQPRSEIYVKSSEKRSIVKNSGSKTGTWRERVGDDSPLIKIDSFRKYTVENSGLCSFGLDNPSSSWSGTQKPFGFSGWIFGKKVTFDSIEICSDGKTVLSIPVNISRPDVVRHYQLRNLDSDTLGFCGYFNPYQLPPRFQVEGFAVSSEGEKIKIFSLVGTRKVPPAFSEFIMKPLFVTTLGRTGSTYLLGLLGVHPEIVVYRPFQVEARYISYWGQMFLSFSHPKSWQFPTASFFSNDPEWIFGDQNGRQLHHALYPAMFQWFDRSYASNLYTFCMNSLQNHYGNVARLEKKQNAVFYAEKFLPNPFTESLLNLMPKAREIFLVRDFRDMFCSINAFNKKRGSLEFGRNQFSNDTDYIFRALAPGADALLESWNQRKDGSLLIRYEDLIREPENQLEKVFQYLEIDPSPATVRKVLDRARRLKPESQKQHKTSSSPQNSLGRYQRELSPELLEVCGKAFGKTLEAFGYPL